MLLKFYCLLPVIVILYPTISFYVFWQLSQMCRNSSSYFLASNDKIRNITHLSWVIFVFFNGFALWQSHKYLMIQFCIIISIPIFELFNDNWSLFITSSDIRYSLSIRIYRCKRVISVNFFYLSTINMVSFNNRIISNMYFIHTYVLYYTEETITHTTYLFATNNCTQRKSPKTQLLL